jgi:hypothetical protein
VATPCFLPVPFAFAGSSRGSSFARMARRRGGADFLFKLAPGWRVLINARTLEGLLLGQTEHIVLIPSFSAFDPSETSAGRDFRSAKNHRSFFAKA